MLLEVQEKEEEVNNNANIAIPQIDVQEEDLSDPIVKIFYDMREIIPDKEQYQWGMKEIREKNRKVLMILNVYNMLKDKTDFLHSFNKLYTLAKK